jgi:hypothetical protein
MLLLRNHQFVEQPTVAQRGHGAGLLDDLAKLLRAQQRHRRHRDQAGLHHREPRERHRHRVAAAQQHAVAGHEPEVFGQHLRDAVDLDGRLRVRERAGRRAQHRLVAEALRIRLVQQFLHEVQLVGQLQLGQVIAKDRQLLGRRQAVVNEAVDLGRHGIYPRRTDLPMISCWTSVAPS